MPEALKQRLIIAALTALIITGCCLYITWKTAGPYVSFPLRYVSYTLRDTDKAIAIYRKERGRWPQSLADLKAISEQIHIWQINGVICDVWEHPLVYQVKEERYILMSYGRDGKPGGIGLDRDMFSAEPPRIVEKLPFFQVISSPSAQGMVQMSFLAGIMAFFLFFTIIKPGDLIREYRVDLCFKVICTFAAALVMAAIITILHVPSRH